MDPSFLGMYRAKSQWMQLDPWWVQHFLGDVSSEMAMGPIGSVVGPTFFRGCLERNGNGSNGSKFLKEKRCKWRCSVLPHFKVLATHCCHTAVSVLLKIAPKLQARSACHQYVGVFCTRALAARHAHVGFRGSGGRVSRPPATDYRSKAAIREARLRQEKQTHRRRSNATITAANCDYRSKAASAAAKSAWEKQGYDKRSNATIRSKAPSEDA